MPLERPSAKRYGGDHAHHALCLQLRHFGRGDVVGDQDLARHPLQFGVAAMQRGMQPPDHLVDVVDAAAQVRIVDALEHAGDAVALQAQRIVGGVQAGADERIDALEQLRVVEQQRVQVQEFTDLVRKRAVQAPRTGFSGLSYLRQVPVDGVKIDRSFIADILRDPDDLALTTAIIGMAHSLGITVVAEGVEKEGQYEVLRERGCDLAQGYWLGHPMTEHDFRGLLA